jgi:hypothetical protein
MPLIVLEIKANDIHRNFMHLSRNRQLWARCLEPFELNEEPAPVYLMNQNLLTSCASSNYSDSRIGSPLSDSDLEVDSNGVQNLHSCPRDYHLPTSLHNVILSTDFNIKAKENERIPYPTDAEERKIWTDDQRAKASQAQIPQDMNDFAQIVRFT